MTENQRPEQFYKNEFCRAVTGLTPSELRDRISSAQDAEGVPTAGEGIGARMGGGFMSQKFVFPIKDLSLQQLYDFLTKFRRFEEHIHPRDQFLTHEGYYGPVYAASELAHSRADVNAIKEVASDLVDLIVHD